MPEVASVVDTEKLKIERECALCGLITDEPVVVCPEDGSALFTHAPDPYIGKEIAKKYEILSLIGTGGMGNVYKALQKHVERHVAFKVLHSEKLSSNSVRRFQQEARAAASISHPNIVSVFDFGITDENIPYLVMDYVEGKPLDALFQENGPIPFQRCVTIFSQACDALEHAHQNGIVHRDIKPSNLMIVQKDGIEQLKILDFGIAKLAPRKDAPEQQALTVTGEIFGSPQYMSPEQWAGDELDARSDMYSLGCVMYEALTGQAPIRGRTLVETIQKHSQEKPAPFASLTPPIAVPEQLEAVVMKTLEKDPKNRFPSMAALKRNLEFAPRFAEDEQKLTPRERGEKEEGETHGSPFDKSNIAFTAVFGLATLAALGVVASILVTNTSAGKAFPPNIRLMIQEKQTGPDSPRLLPLLDELRDDAAAKADLKQALEYAKRATDIASANEANTFISASEKLKYADLLKRSSDAKGASIAQDALAELKTIAENNRKAGKVAANLGEAEPIDKTICKLEQQNGANSASYAHSLIQLAQDTCTANGAEFCEPELQQISALSVELSKDDATKLIACEKAAADRFSVDGHSDKAEHYYKQAIDLATKQEGQQSEDVASLQTSLALMYQHYGRYIEAEPLLLDALANMEAATGERSTKAVAILQNLGQLYKDMKEFKKAADFYKLANEMKSATSKSQAATTSNETSLAPNLQTPERQGL